MNNQIFTILRNTLPNLIAHQIVGVQPMTGAADSFFDVKFQYHDHPRYKFSRKWYIGKVTSHTALVDQWCETTFGPQPKNPDAWCRWYRYSFFTFYFRDEKDFTQFLLRWS